MRRREYINIEYFTMQSNSAIMVPSWLFAVRRRRLVVKVRISTHNQSSNPASKQKGNPRALMVKCPQCGGTDVHKSLGAYFGERLMLAFIFRRPVRCYTCMNRFTIWMSANVQARI